MSKIRINELARQLEVKSREVIEKLQELGIAEKVTHSSSIDDDMAERLRRYYSGDGASERKASAGNGAGADHDDADEMVAPEPVSRPVESARTAAPVTDAPAQKVGTPADAPAEDKESEKEKSDDFKPRPLPIRPPLSRGTPIHPPVGARPPASPAAPPVSRTTEGVIARQAGPSTPPARPAVPPPPVTTPPVAATPPRPVPPPARPIPSAPPKPGQILSGPRQPLPANLGSTQPRPAAAPPAARPGVPIAPPPQRPVVSAPTQTPGAPRPPQAPPPGRPIAGQPVARPVVPPRPDLVTKLAQQQRAPMPGQAPPRPGVPLRPQSPRPGQPLYQGPPRPGQPMQARGGRPGMPGPGGRPGMGPRPMHPTTRGSLIGPGAPPPPPDQ